MRHLQSLRPLRARRLGRQLLARAMMASAVMVGVAATAGGSTLGPAVAGAATAAQWSTMATVDPGPNPQLNAVSCTSASFCVAVGQDYNAIPGYPAYLQYEAIAEEWNGSTWSAIAPVDPGSASQLSAISCTSPVFCMAAGLSWNGSSNFTTLAEIWNGSAWSVVPTVDPNIYNLLSTVSCTSPSFCVAGGQYNNGARPQTLAETWDGSSWTRTPTTDLGVQDSINGASCASASFCVGVSAYEADYSNAHWQTLGEEWDGSAWSTMTTVDGYSDTSTNFVNELLGVSCISSSFCMAAGDYYYDFLPPATPPAQTLAEVWNGSSWSATATTNPSFAQQLQAVSCTRESFCIAVGSQTNDQSTGYLGASGGAAQQTLAEAWDGSAWSTMTTTDPDSSDLLQGVSCTVTGFCVAVGSSTDSAGVHTLAESFHALPTSKDQCMNGGWRSFGVFKNQGDCVSYVATKGKNPPG
jgi:hypothetical protein